MKGSRSGKNINEAIILILVKIKVINKLSYFTTDNVSTNNITIKVVYNVFALIFNNLELDECVT
jgi:hypothetical protein